MNKKLEMSKKGFEDYKKGMKIARSICGGCLFLLTSIFLLYSKYLYTKNFTWFISCLILFMFCLVSTIYFYGTERSYYRRYRDKVFWNNLNIEIEEKSKKNIDNLK